MVFMLKILFWGTGSYAFEWMIHNRVLLQSVSYHFIERNLVENEFMGKQVIKPEEIKQFEYDYLCILSAAFEAIKLDAVGKYGVEEKKILSDYELETKLLSDSKQNVTDTILLHHIAKSTPGMERLKSYCDYTYIKQTYQDYVNNWTYIEHPKQDNEEKIVWICWYQGYENAPPIVKACINSIKMRMGKTHDIRIITEDNMEDYVKFPDDIKEKYRKGIISKPFFSDLLRLELLLTYGGIWIDATILLTASIPKIIQDSDLFMFRFTDIGEMYPHIASSWFMVSKPHNKILMLVRDLLYEYWVKHERIIHYLLIYLFFRMAIEKFSEEWKQVIWHTNGNIREVLFNSLFEPYDEQRYKYYTQVEFCHKLTYKLDVPEETEGTIYAKILEEYLPKEE